MSFNLFFLQGEEIVWLMHNVIFPLEERALVVQILAFASTDTREPSVKLVSNRFTIIIKIHVCFWASLFKILSLALWPMRPLFLCCNSSMTYYAIMVQRRIVWWLSLYSYISFHSIRRNSLFKVHVFKW